MNSKSYFTNLDGLRTIACMMVFFWHAMGIGHIETGFSKSVFDNLAVAVLNGKNGVSIFFVLSGFLITYLILQEIKKTGRLNLPNFYIRRTLRIWPLYFLVLVIIFVIIPLANTFRPIIYTEWDSNPAYYFFFLSNFDVLRIFESNGTDFLPSTITWSVAIEEQFYLFWPLLFLIFPINKVQYAIVAAIAASLLYRVLNYFEHPFRLYFHTLSAVFDLSIGGIAAWLCFASNNFRKCFERIRDSGRIVIWICGLLLMYINVATSSGPLQLLTKHLQVVFFAIVIVDQCFGGPGKLKLSNSRLLTNVGKYTYGVYMLHTLVLLAINTISIRVLGLQNHDFYAAVIRVVVGLPLTILVAWLSYQVFERRFLSMKEKFQFQKKVVVR